MKMDTKPMAAPEPPGRPPERIHPRFLAAAGRNLSRLRAKLRAAYGTCTLSLEELVAQSRALAARDGGPRARGILQEFEKALAEIRALAASEIFDIGGLAALQHRLEQVNEDLHGLRKESVARVERLPTRALAGDPAAPRFTP
jgi:predicted component of type VI protein secretion system